MYRSLLTIHLDHPSSRQALSNCQDMHRNLMKAFPEADASRKEANVLYRLFTIEERPALFVLSSELPDWEKVTGISLYQNKMPLQMDVLFDKLTTGRALRFSLKTSPCKKVSGERKNSKRVFLRNAEERAAWLCRKGQQNGFEVLRLSESETDIVHGRKETGEIFYQTVTFDGVLRITDEARFREAFKNGIGPGKAYGLGLLMLAKTL